MTKPAETLPPSTNAAMRTVTSDATALEHTLIRALMVVRDAQPRVLKGGGVSKTFYKKLASVLGPDATPLGIDAEDYHTFVVSLLISAGLAISQDGRLVEDGQACEQFFAHDAERRVELLRDAWLEGDLLNEFLAIRTLTIPGARASSNVSRADHVPGAKRMREIRGRVIELIGELELGKWTKFASLLDLAEEEVSDLLIPHDNTPMATSAYYIGVRSLDGRSDLARDGNWRAVEGALIEELVRVPLSLLGYLDISIGSDESASDSGDSATEASRIGHRPLPPIVALRRRRSPREERATPVSDKPLLIQGNFEVTALLPEMSMLALWRLARLSSVASFAQVAHFQIEERWVATAVNAGVALDSLCEFLESHSKTGLPQNVRYTLSEWVRRTERITIYPDAYVFQAEGVENLEALVQEAYRRRAPLAKLAERHLVGAAAQCPEPREGIAPRYPVLDYSRPLPPVVVAHDNGMLACELEQVNFRVMQALSRIAEQISIERWRLTAGSVQDALAKGMPFERLMSVLTGVLRNDLPPVLRAKLLVWGGRFGGVALGSLRVLSFARAASAQLLRMDERFGKLLGDALNPTAFRVPAELEPELIDALKDLGTGIDEGVLSNHARQDSHGPLGIAGVRTSPAHRSEDFDASRFRKSWDGEHRDQALDYATANGVTLEALVQFGSEAAPKRVQLEPIRWIGFDGGGYLEARVDRRDVRIMPLAAIFEAEPS